MLLRTAIDSDGVGRWWVGGGIMGKRWWRELVGGVCGGREGGKAHSLNDR